MFVHSVFFWLRPDLTDAERAEFDRGIQSLKTVPSVGQVFIGNPAPIPKRPVVDDSYSYALTILFKDVASHDAYQVDPIHKAFVNGCKHLWNKVQIYDAC